MCRPATELQQSAVTLVRQAMNADMAVRRKRNALTVDAVGARVASMATLAPRGLAKLLGWL